MTVRSFVLALGILALAAGSVRLSGQQPQSVDPSQQAYLSRATAVLVDVVVRDRQGRPVVDLKADDFEITEDGIPQRVGSFTLVSRGTGVGIGVHVEKDDPTTVVMPTGSADSDPQPVTTPVIALVFDALSPEGLGLCQRAALQSISMAHEMNARMGVFLTEPRPSSIAELHGRSRVDQSGHPPDAISSGMGGKETRDERITALRERLSAMETSGFDMENSAAIHRPVRADDQGAGVVGQVEVQRRLAQGGIRMLQSFEDLDRDHRGYGTTNALIAVFQWMVVSRPEERPVLLGGTAGIASVAVAVGVAHRDGEQVEHHGVRRGCERIESLEQHAETHREVDALANERRRQIDSGTDSATVHSRKALNAPRTCFGTTTRVACG